MNEEEFIKNYFESKSKKESLNEIAYAPLVPALLAYYGTRIPAKMATQGKFFSDKKESDKEDEKKAKSLDYKERLDNLTSTVRENLQLYFKFFIITYTIDFKVNKKSQIDDTEISNLFDTLFRNSYECPIIKQRFLETKKIMTSNNLKIGSTNISKDSFYDMMYEIYVSNKGRKADILFNVINRVLTQFKGKITRPKIEQIYNEFKDQASLDNAIG